MWVCVVLCLPTKKRHLSAGRVVSSTTPKRALAKTNNRISLWSVSPGAVAKEERVHACLLSGVRLSIKIHTLWIYIIYSVGRNGSFFIIIFWLRLFAGVACFCSVHYDTVQLYPWSVGTSSAAWSQVRTCRVACSSIIVVQGIS